MAGKDDPLDPKGLIRESYRIDGIAVAECRSIFLDWALGLPEGSDATASIRALLQRYADQPKSHPMTVTLVAGLDDAGPVRRRGGRKGRSSSQT